MKDNKNKIILAIVLLIVLILIIQAFKGGSNKSVELPTEQEVEQTLAPDQTLIINNELKLTDSRYIHPIHDYSFSVPTGYNIVEAFKGNDTKKKNSLIAIVPPTQLEGTVPLRESVIIELLPDSIFAKLFEKQELLSINTYTKNELGVIHLLHTRTKDASKEHLGADEGHVIKKEGKQDIVVQAFYETIEPTDNLRQITSEIIVTFSRN